MLPSFRLVVPAASKLTGDRRFRIMLDMESNQREPLSEKGRPHFEYAFRWVAHPLFSRPLRSLAVLSFLCLLFMLVYLITSSRAWMTLAALVMLGSLRQFFLPTTFLLSDEMVVSRFLWFERKRPWEHFRSCFIDENGVLLSPFSRPSRLEAFRGLYLIGANAKPDVVAFIRKKLADGSKK